MESNNYKQLFLEYLEEEVQVIEPKNLYEPIEYILDLGGKRMRPILVLMGVEAFGGEIKEGLPAALAVEVFHNFTLLHDDIMDDAPIRRNKPTVHEKWDTNTAILSGDAMLILSYKMLEKYQGEAYRKLMVLFNQTSLEVCEGQQFDMDFETLQDVEVEKYIKMIGLKTSVLVAAALKMGAIIAEANEKDADAIYSFGLNLGIAFQLQDDYLDTFGDVASFGKQIGGDIIENKKTYLYIEALKVASGELKEELLGLYAVQPEDSSEKVKRVKEIFKQTGVDISIKKQISDYTEKAFEVLNTIEMATKNKEVLKKFGENLMVRNS